MQDVLCRRAGLELVLGEYDLRMDRHGGGIGARGCRRGLVGRGRFICTLFADLLDVALNSGYLPTGLEFFAYAFGFACEEDGLKGYMGR